MSSVVSLVGHALIDVTSGWDVLNVLSLVVNQFTCIVLHVLNDRFDLYPLRIVQCFVF